MQDYVLRVLGVFVMGLLGRLFGSAGKAADNAVDKVAGATTEAVTGQKSSGGSGLFNLAALGGAGFGAYKLYENWDDPKVQEFFQGIVDYFQDSYNDPDGLINKGLDTTQGAFNSAKGKVIENQDAIQNFLLHVLLPGFIGGRLLSGVLGTKGGATGLAVSVVGAFLAVQTWNNPDKVMSWLPGGDSPASSSRTLASFDGFGDSPELDAPENV